MSRRGHCRAKRCGELGDEKGLLMGIMEGARGMEAKWEWKGSVSLETPSQVRG